MVLAVLFAAVAVVLAVVAEAVVTAGEEAVV